jgi:hypothetical protein
MLMSAVNAQTQEIVTCRDPAGKAYWHFDGLAEKARSGWADDKLSGGSFTLVQLESKEFDLLYVDTRRKPISSLQDGAIIRPMRASPSAVQILIYYPTGSTTEIYTFFREKDGTSRFTLMTGRVGGDAPFPKSSLLVGTCDALRMDLIR